MRNEAGKANRSQILKDLIIHDNEFGICQNEEREVINIFKEGLILFAFLSVKCGKSMENILDEHYIYSSCTPVLSQKQVEGHQVI